MAALVVSFVVALVLVAPAVELVVVPVFLAAVGVAALEGLEVLVLVVLPVAAVLVGAPTAVVVAAALEFFEVLVGELFEAPAAFLAAPAGVRARPVRAGVGVGVVVLGWGPWGLWAMVAEGLVVPPVPPAVGGLVASLPAGPGRVWVAAVVRVLRAQVTRGSPAALAARVSWAWMAGVAGIVMRWVGLCRVWRCR